MEVFLRNGLRDGESIFKTIGDILIQVKSNRESRQAPSDVDFRALPDREAAAKNLEELVAPLAELSPEESQAFADQLFGYGPGGIKLLNTLILTNKLKNYHLNDLPPKESQDFAIMLLGYGPEGIELLDTLILNDKLKNYHFNDLTYAQSKNFADMLFRKYGKAGIELLNTLILSNKLKNYHFNDLTNAQSKALGDQFLGYGPKGIKLLNTLILNNKLKNYHFNDLTPAQSQDRADKLLGYGAIGAVCLKILITQHKLKNYHFNDLTADKYKDFVKKLRMCGAFRLEYLKTLIAQRRLENPDFSGLTAEESQAFANMLLGCGPEGAGYLKFLIEQGRLPHLDLSKLPPTSSVVFVNNLLKCGSEGAECARFLIEQRRLSNFDPSKLSPKPSKAFVKMLLKCGSAGAGYLKFLIEQGSLPNLDLRTLPPDEPKALVKMLLRCGPAGAECLMLLVEKLNLSNLDPSTFFADRNNLIKQLLAGDSLMKQLLLCGSEGAEYLKFLIVKNKGSGDFTEEESQDFAEIFTHGSEFSAKCLRNWVEEGIFPNLKLYQLHEEVLLQLDLHKPPKDQVAALVKALLDSPTPSNLSLLGRLIEWNKLSFDPSPPRNIALLDISLLETNHDAFAVALAGGGAFSVNLLTQLAVAEEPPKLVLSNLSPTSSVAFAYRLLGCGSEGADLLIKLIEENKLTYLPSPEDMEARASRFKHLHSTFESGIRQAFFGRTDGIDDASWNGVRVRLANMTPGEARGIWQTITNEVAVNCFDANGHVDVERLEEWMEFFGNAETFRTVPYCFIPIGELMRSQIYTVCECLWTNKNGSRDRLDAANGIPVGEHRKSLLAAISRGRESPLKPSAAILASLFTPHRQLGFPACAIHSLLNAEIRNHPERLIEIYTQMLSSDQFTFPSGYAVRQQPIVDGFITIDLANGGKGR
ncbi:MAG: hypothetical protein LBS22_03015, partial [Puniceicoccales bacterium]|nr:hypothetical protein [Puniceicoccales bacterium]